MTVNDKSKNILTPFQEWVLLFFHQNPNTHVSVHYLITNCCLTAINDEFNTESVLRDLETLVAKKLIRKYGEVADPNVEPELLICIMPQLQKA